MSSAAHQTQLKNDLVNCKLDRKKLCKTIQKRNKESKKQNTEEKVRDIEDTVRQGTVYIYLESQKKRTENKFGQIVTEFPKLRKDINPCFKKVNKS